MLNARQEWIDLVQRNSEADVCTVGFCTCDPVGPRLISSSKGQLAWVRNDQPTSSKDTCNILGGRTVSLAALETVDL